MTLNKSNIEELKIGYLNSIPRYTNLKFKLLAGGSTLDLHKDPRIKRDFGRNVLPWKRNSKLNLRTKLNIVEKIVTDKFDSKEVTKICNFGVSTVYLVRKEFSSRGMNAIIDKNRDSSDNLIDEIKLWRLILEFVEGSSINFTIEYIQNYLLSTYELKTIINKIRCILKW